MSSKSTFSNSTSRSYALALYELSKENSEIDKIEIEMNKFFGNAVNNELMGNCLRWIAKKI